MTNRETRIGELPATDPNVLTAQRRVQTHGASTATGALTDGLMESSILSSAAIFFNSAAPVWTPTATTLLGLNIAVGGQTLSFVSNIGGTFDVQAGSGVTVLAGSGTALAAGVLGIMAVSRTAVSTYTIRCSWA